MSCWWSFCTDSRCRMKSWGGFGIRSFDDETTKIPNGRAWVLSLDATLHPTHDALNAAAYVLFNPKGKLCSPTHARIMATLTGRPYKAIHFTHPVDSSEHLWQGLKSDGGVYIVADQKICDATDSLCLDYESHEKFDAEKFQKAA